MQRADITAIFPDATPEQLNAIMDLNGADINAAKKDYEKLAGELKTAQEGLAAAAAQDQSEDLKKALADLEKVTTELNGMKAADALRVTREKVAKDKNVPVNLLTGETEEACAAQADAILAFAKPDGLSIRDGGEPAAKGCPSTRDQFANWAKDNF